MSKQAGGEEGGEEEAQGRPTLRAVASGSDAEGGEESDTESFPPRCRVPALALAHPASPPTHPSRRAEPRAHRQQPPSVASGTPRGTPRVFAGAL